MNFKCLWINFRLCHYIGKAKRCEPQYYGIRICITAYHLWELWQVIRPLMTLRISEDSISVASIICKGFSRKLRHLAKTHRVNVASTCEVVNQNDDMLIQHVGTNDQRSDIMTKGLPMQKRERALSLLNMKFT